MDSGININLTINNNKEHTMTDKERMRQTRDEWFQNDWRQAQDEWYQKDWRQAKSWVWHSGGFPTEEYENIATNEELHITFDTVDNYRAWTSGPQSYDFLMKQPGVLKKHTIVYEKRPTSPSSYEQRMDKEAERLAEIQTETQTLVDNTFLKLSENYDEQVKEENKCLNKRIG